MDYKLIRPCSNCPFRSDLPANQRGWLNHRIVEIVENTVLGNSAFTCHKTLKGEWNEDEEGNGYYTPSQGEQHCAGALIMANNVGRLWHNQATRMAERFGMFDFDKLDTSAPVFKTVDECYDFHEAE